MPEGVSRPHQYVLEMGAEMMAHYGLSGWRLRLDHARRRAGQCDYTNKIISLSRHYVRYAEENHIRDTLLHEIAHALVGPFMVMMLSGERKLVRSAVQLRDAILLPFHMQSGKCAVRTAVLRQNGIAARKILSVQHAALGLSFSSIMVRRDGCLLCSW